MKLLTKIGMIACGLAIAPSMVNLSSCSKEATETCNVEFRGNLTSGFNITYSDTASNKEDYVVKFESAVDENGKPTHENVEKDDIRVICQTPKTYSTDGYGDMDFIVENNTLTIKRETISSMFKDIHESTKKITPHIRITFLGAQISDNITWDSLKEIASDPETGIQKAKSYFSYGDWKYLTINGKKHKVKIVGIGESFVSDDIKAVFTFEFNNVLTQSNGKADTYAWNDKNGSSSTSNDFSTGSLNEHLNNEIKTLISNALGTAADGIKTIYAGCSYFDGSKWSYKSYPTSIFMKLYERQFTYWTDVINANKSEISDEKYLEVSTAEGSNFDNHYWFTMAVPEKSISSHNLAYCLEWSTLYCNMSGVYNKRPILPCFCF